MSRLTLFENQKKIREFQKALHVAGSRPLQGESDGAQFFGQNNVGQSLHEDTLAACDASEQRGEDPF
jgi:hypothetical protein